MDNFTFEETNLMCIYNTGTRQGLLDALADMRQHLDSDTETELLALMVSVMEKLRIMSDAAFAELELYPDFDVEQ